MENLRKNNVHGRQPFMQQRRMRVEDVLEITADRGGLVPSSCTNHSAGAGIANQREHKRAGKHARWESLRIPA